METETKVGVGIVLALIVSFFLVGDTDLEPTHYCLDREIKSFCYDLSSTGKTCYTEPDRIGGKRCTEGWEEIPFIETVTSTRINQDVWHCSNKGCS